MKAMFRTIRTHRLRALSQRFRRDDRGLAALEFAMIVPLMLAFFFGMVEITNGVAADRKVAIVARTLSDLTSRSDTVTATDVSNFFKVGDTIMQPYANDATTPLVSTITEIYIDPRTSAGRVQWSQKSTGVAGYTAGSAITVPTGLIAKDSNGKTIDRQYLILSEVSYLYKPAVAYFMSAAGIYLTDKNYTRPRQIDCVYYLLKGVSCPTT